MGGNEPQISIREATAEDAELITAVLQASFAEYKAAFTTKAFTATTPTREHLIIRLSEGPIWVAFQGKIIVGTVSAVPKSEGVYLRSLAILPSARGQGIGRLLLKQVEEFALRHGYECVFLSTAPFLAQAIRLYERCGFHRSDEGADELFGTPLFTMVKILKPGE
ncbi:MAG: GNAT family N-acetyltransferase [Ktedonobacteraceae bacterium]|nr:GNAT family N-acetyltransferase [Ktedonobacteraceae bacterium]